MQHRFMTVYDSTLYPTLRIRNIVPQRRKNSDETIKLLDSYSMVGNFI